MEPPLKQEPNKKELFKKQEEAPSLESPLDPQEKSPIDPPLDPQGEPQIDSEEKEYIEASIAEQQTRIQLLMEDRSICSVRQTPNELQTNDKYQKKIQLKTPLVDYEWKLSQKIQEIPHTQLYFSTMIEPPTTTEMGSITEDNIENCTKKLQTKTDEKPSELVTTTYKNKKSITLLQHILQQKIKYSEYTFMTIIDTFQQLLYAIQKLQQSESLIVMFDIQPEFILYDITNNTPFLIDHRLAIQIDDLKDKQNCKKLIPHYDLPYPIIPIEIWLLSNIVELDPQETFNQEKLNQWITEYNSQISPNTYIEEYKTYLQQFQTWDQLQEELIKTANMWDVYMIAINYQQLCSQLELDNLRVQLDENTPKYPFLESWYNILEEIIMTIPNKRPSIQEIIEKINSIAIADKEIYQSFVLEFLG